MTIPRIKMLSSKKLMALLTIVVTLMAVILFWPHGYILSSQSHPARNYVEAVQRIKALDTLEPSGMDPKCRIKFMTHGRKTEHAIVFVHGYTSSPLQFLQLGGIFYNLGYNVLIAPLPHHGLADRMTADHAALEAEELVKYANEVLDIAQGLGKHVVMTGISAGGVTTAWAAQNRNDLDLAVIISPAFGLKSVLTPLTGCASNFLLNCNNFYIWGDPVLQAQALPKHTYPRFASHALGQILRLGLAIRRQAEEKPPRAKSIIIVTNAKDGSVNNDETEEMVRIWRRHGSDLTKLELDAKLSLNHDLIDPEQPNQRTNIVYPQLISLIVGKSNYPPTEPGALRSPAPQGPDRNSKVKVKTGKESAPIGRGFKTAPTGGRGTILQDVRRVR